MVYGGGSSGSAASFRRCFLWAHCGRVVLYRLAKPVAYDCEPPRHTLEYCREIPCDRENQLHNAAIAGYLSRMFGALIHRSEQIVARLLPKAPVARRPELLAYTELYTLMVFKWLSRGGFTRVLCVDRRQGVKRSVAFYEWRKGDLSIVSCRLSESLQPSLSMGRITEVSGFVSSAIVKCCLTGAKSDLQQ